MPSLISRSGARLSQTPEHPLSTLGNHETLHEAFNLKRVLLMSTIWVVTGLVRVGILEAKLKDLLGARPGLIPWGEVGGVESGCRG